MKILNKTMITKIKVYAKTHTVKETAEYFSVSYDSMQAYMARHSIAHAPRKSNGEYNSNYKVGFAMNKKLYWVYGAMLQRCYKANCKQYHRYGGRGITVCDEWRNDKTAFYKWAVSNGYKEGLTLDRIDNDGNYSPDNCRWVSYGIQGNNTSSCHYLEFKGKKQSMSDWAKELGLNYFNLRSKIRNGWTIEEVIRGRRCQK